ncbi:MAG: UDP-N-acetylmuramoyl-tripeptide--D-alanyl-D-alanine ligase [Acidimicrobiia bacterium]|nr:UDP-N-acetylmuramoyl-tripeptide--D-alanyl-D-alanine ligase [Acidimicrobiia bacterium]NNL48900.1 UDP-N-acetylmuramoyl-tripeptide--D-alanyl-D-alanine ligase [Acidimicrobiia bacterium]
MRWTLDHVAGIVGGSVGATGVITSVSIDSRRPVDSETLFVAIKGEVHDGHDFVGEVLQRGVGAVLVERSAGSANEIVVEDTLVALSKLASARRNEVDIPAIGITGSSGKTSTKDLVSSVLGSDAHASPKSFNNEIGVPLTILGTPDTATYLVIEVGSRGRGHIEKLVDIIKPTIAVITTIGVAHSEFLKNEADVRNAKFELAIGTDGPLVLPAGDTELIAMAAGRDVLTFGSERSSPDGADYWATDLELDDLGRVGFRMVTPTGSLRVQLGVSGLHNAHNAAAAIAVGQLCDVDIPDIAERLQRAALSPWRMEVHRGRYTVVNDSYNANPESMASALETVAAMGGRPVAILGAMEELGDREVSDHLAIGDLARSLGFKIVTIGPDRGYRPDVTFESVEAAATGMREIIAADDTVLIKASRAAGLERLAASLIADLEEART